MTQIALKDYWMGRDQQYPRALSTEIRQEAERTVECVNKLLRGLSAASVETPRSPRTGSVLTSGWRPPEVNEAIPGAAPRSHHIWGRAADIYDPEGEIDDYLMTTEGQELLTKLGLWMEHPSATKGWCHVQTRPPRSGRRVFYP